MSSQQDIPVPVALNLSPSVFAQLQQTIGAHKAESGGMLGGNRTTGEVTAFHFDDTALEQSAATYTPNHTLLTRVLKEEWKPNKIDLLGFIHSHPPSYNHPSPWDRQYAGTILESMDLPYLLLPIIRTAVDAGAFALFPYVASRENDGVVIAKQALVVGGRPVVYEQRDLRPEEADTLPADLLPWKMVAALDLAALIIGVGITGAHLVRELRQFKHRQEDE